MTGENAGPEWRTAIWWVLGTALGITLAGALNIAWLAQARRIFVPPYGTQNLYGYGLIFVLTVSIFGVAQWIPLRALVPVSGLWVLASIPAGLLIMAAVSVPIQLVEYYTSLDVLFSLPALLIFGGPIGGLVIGYTQSLVLVPARRWVIANLLAWTIGVATIAIPLFLVNDASPALYLRGPRIIPFLLSIGTLVAGGVIVGLLTGVALIKNLRTIPSMTSQPTITFFGDVPTGRLRATRYLAVAMAGILSLVGLMILFDLGPFAPGNADKLQARYARGEHDFYGLWLWRSDLSGVNLAGASLDNAILVEVSLREAQLTDVSFVSAVLRGGDLRQAVLSDAHFERAILAAADLREANLEQAHLNQADLTGANLTGANLTGADLMGANLTSANLSNANLSGAFLSFADLTDAEITVEQLEQAASLTGATMPDGTKRD